MMRTSEDCISRQALIDEILEDGNGAVLSYPTGMYEDDLVESIEKQMIQHFIKVIEYVPTVEPERPRGEWVDMSDGGRIKYIWYEKYMCNKCGERGTSAWSFCPNCGADMKGDK